MRKLLRKKGGMSVVNILTILTLVLFAGAHAFAADAVVAGQAAGSSIQVAVGNVVATPVVVTGAASSVGAAGGLVAGGVVAGAIAVTGAATSSNSGTTTQH